MRIGSILLVIWLIVGAIAAGQRHEFSRAPARCNNLLTIAVTILAGPAQLRRREPKDLLRYTSSEQIAGPARSSGSWVVR